MGDIVSARLPMPTNVEPDYGIDNAGWRVLVESIFPAARTPEAVEMALAYCKVRKLDVMKRPVHIVPVWDKKTRKEVETVWPGLHEIRSTAHRTDSYAGCDEIEFGPDITETIGGVSVTYPASAKVTVYRVVQGTRCPFTQIVHWKETFSAGKGGRPTPMWLKRPHDQLAKCAEVAALRMAFPEELGNDYIAEEMAGKEMEFVEPRAVVKDVPAAVVAPTGTSKKLDSAFSLESPPVETAEVPEPIEAIVTRAIHNDENVQNLLKAFPGARLEVKPSFETLRDYMRAVKAGLEAMDETTVDVWDKLLEQDVAFLQNCGHILHEENEVSGQAIKNLREWFKEATQKAIDALQAEHDINEDIPF